ncbi:MAG: DUF120 domain-containing protein [Halobacteriaceae archaeon]
MADVADSQTTDHAELAALKQIALAGAASGTVKLSCGDLADRLDVSAQTASRRLQALEGAGHVERELAGDGQLVTVTGAGEAALRAEYEEYRRIFEDGAAERLSLEGTVTGGMGEGRHYISLPGYSEQFRERLGYEPFPGTLNVDLAPAGVRARSALEAVEAVPIDGWADEDRTYGPAVCYPATVATDGDSYESAHVIEPERTHHDDDHLEVIAPDRLRDALDLADGDRVTIHVTGA